MVSGVSDFFQISRASRSEFATRLLPGQDNPAPSSPVAGASWFVVSCGVRLSEVGLSEIRKPQVGGPQKPTAGGNTLTNYHKDRASSLNQREQRSCSMLRWRYAPAVGVNTITVFSESFLNCNWQSRTLPGARLSVCQGEAHTRRR